MSFACSSPPAPPTVPPPLALHRALPGSTLRWVPGGDLIPAYSPTTLAGLVLDAALRTPEGLRRPEGGVR